VRKERVGIWRIMDPEDKCVKSTLIHTKWYQSRDFTCIFQVKREGKGRQSAGDSVAIVCR
jgi:hypothetical protein